MDPTMLMPMIQTFVTQDTIKGIADATGQMLRDRNIDEVGTYNGGVYDSIYTPEEFVYMVFCLMMESLTGEPFCTDTETVNLHDAATSSS